MTDILWLEKYRPRTLDEVVGNKRLVNKLKILEEDKNIPHMILSGPPGCGKTSSVSALAQSILKENSKNAILELNASDERGIETVRSRLKQFAGKKVNLPKGQHKIVILDEADSMTESSQQALRMIITDYSDSTRFIFSCNDSTKIIEPIQSRCAILRFSRLEQEDIKEYLKRIIQLEKIDCTDAGLNALLFIADGDMRNAVNNLQAVWMAKDKISKDGVYEICDVPDQNKIEEMLKEIQNRNFDLALDMFHFIWNQNYSIHDLVNYIQRTCERTNEIDYRHKVEFLNCLGSLKVLDSTGLGTKTQILACLSKMYFCAEKLAGN